VPRQPTTLRRAPESGQEKYRKMSELFEDFFGKRAGTKGDTNQAMEEMEVFKALNGKE
jgi:hypothetical protein